MTAAGWTLDAATRKRRARHTDVSSTNWRPGNVLTEVAPVRRNEPARRGPYFTGDENAVSPSSTSAQAQ